MSQLDDLAAAVKAMNQSVADEVKAVGDEIERVEAVIAALSAAPTDSAVVAQAITDLKTATSTLADSKAVLDKERANVINTAAAAQIFPQAPGETGEQIAAKAAAKRAAEQQVIFDKAARDKAALDGKPFPAASYPTASYPAGRNFPATEADDKAEAAREAKEARERRF